jgi:hypothetical protein
MVRRRTVRVAALAVVLSILIPTGFVTAAAFGRACDGSLEGLRYLANVRAQVAAATAPTPAPPPTSAPTPTRPAPVAAQPPATPALPTPTETPPPPAEPSVVQRSREASGRVIDGALATLIRIKQDDRVAYPAHLAAARVLGVAGCSADAVRLQWLKGGLHASGAGQPEYIAAALRAEARDPADLADLRRIVRTWTERASDNVSLYRVLAALDG